MKFEELRPAQLDVILREFPFAVIPWGAHEWHGPQNPMGLDTLKAHAMGLDLVKEVGGVVLPPVYCGFNTIKEQIGYRHTLEFDRETLQALVRQYLQQLYEDGFRVMLIIMGHYGGLHTQAIHEVVDRFNGGHSMSRVVAWEDFVPASWVGINGADHAGRNETSLMMHYRPDLVDLSQLPADGDLDLFREGVMGEDARLSTSEHGQRLTEVFVREAAVKIREMMAEVRELEARSQGRL